MVRQESESSMKHLMTSVPVGPETKKTMGVLKQKIMLPFLLRIKKEAHSFIFKMPWIKHVIFNKNI